MVKIKKRFLLSAVTVLTAAVTSWATVPPPPVNQFIGISDTSFNNLTEPECRVCHEDPTIVDPGTIPDRHHLLIDQPIPPGSVIPFPNGATYECLSCHQQEWDNDLMAFVFVEFRNCLFCHEQTGPYTVHHSTPQAQGGDCKICHGDIVNNMGDGHYIPTYDPSLVTPFPSGKPNGGATNPINNVEEGNCNFCHDQGADVAPGSATNFLILSNNITHHSTGFGSDNSKCAWCHDTSLTPEFSIRVCEGCHGPDSLHNIQVDSDNAANIGTIVPGAEDAYWGHIGNNNDCSGCHGFSAMSAAAPYSGPTVPDIAELDAYMVTAGAATIINASGNGFTNDVDTGAGGVMTLTSSVVLTAADGTETTLTPTAITESSLTVTVPADMDTGNYTFRVVKGPKESNAVNLSVIPLMDGYNVSCRGNGGVTVKGTGFSEYFEGASSIGFTAADRNGEIECVVKSWTDTKITATCAACPDSVKVQSIWGESVDRSRKLRSRR